MLLGLDEYIRAAERVHGHVCAGQILGLRLAVYGLKLLGIKDPTGKDRKRLLTYVEIDRCATDAITVVTGCRLGKRTLKAVDFGKLAATFWDLQQNRGVRVVAKDTARQQADQLYPGIPVKALRQLRAYREMVDQDLFEFEWVSVAVRSEDLPGYVGPRLVCSVCGESINFKREVIEDDRILCKACAGQRYYRPINNQCEHAPVA